MISDKMAEALNKQLNRELSSSYIYLAMSGYFESLGFSGMAAWMSAQAQEENAHGMKIWGYLFDQDCKVSLEGIEQPQNEYGSVLAAFEEALKHEKYITASINSLVAQAVQENDYATAGFLQWFLREQVEEEASVRTIIDKLEKVKDLGHGLLLIDRELSVRPQQGH